MVWRFVGWAKRSVPTVITASEPGGHEAIHLSSLTMDCFACARNDVGRRALMRLPLVADRAEMLIDAKHDQDEFRGDP